MSERDAPSTWRKSSFSQSGDCVEWSCLEGFVCVRSSEEDNGPVLRFTNAEWRAFIAGVKSLARPTRMSAIRTSVHAAWFLVLARNRYHCSKLRAIQWSAYPRTPSLRQQIELIKDEFDHSLVYLVSQCRLIKQRGGTGG